jgi:hypothetical protein
MSVMVRERWAWRWAKRNALFWTPRMERNMNEGLQWYAPRAKAIDAEQRPWREAEAAEARALNAELREAYEAADLPFPK